MGRPLADLPQVLRAVLYVLKEGASWRALDAHGVCWQTVYGHFRRWCRSGLWDVIMQQLPWHSRRRLVMVDATHIKVHRDGANPAGGQAAQAMGRTKGGLNTKLHALTDDRSQPQCLILTAGPEADVVHAPSLLEAASARHVLMDRAYDSDALREFVAAKGMQACIPPRKNRNDPALLRCGSLQEAPSCGELLREAQTLPQDRHSLRQDGRLIHGLRPHRLLCPQPAEAIFEHALELSYHVPGQFTEKGPKGFQVDDLRDFQIADIAFRGRGKLPGASIFVTPEYRFFVVDRRANTLHWQDSLADQSSWIVQNLNLEESDFRRLNWWDAQPVNPLFPWNLFYYSIAPLVCFFFAWKSRPRHSSSPGSGSHVPPG